MSPLINALGGSKADHAPVRKVKMKAGGTIAKGDWVMLSTTDTDSDDYGFIVLQGTTGLIPLGVAQEAAVDGGYLWVQTWGLGLVDLVTDGSVAEAAWIIPDAVAGAVSTDALDADVVTGLVLALALEDDVSTAQPAGTYFLCPLLGAGA